jgi:hypothetical protein
MIVLLAAAGMYAQAGPGADGKKRDILDRPEPGAVDSAAPAEPSSATGGNTGSLMQGNPPGSESLPGDTLGTGGSVNPSKGTGQELQRSVVPGAPPGGATGPGPDRSKGTSHELQDSIYGKENEKR